MSKFEQYFDKTKDKIVSQNDIAFQLRLHKEMTDFSDAFILGKKIRIATCTTNEEKYVPYKYGNEFIENPSYEDSRAITSDDTKEIERRPHKHLTTTSTITSDDRLKRRRHTPAIADDSSEAGPSGSHTNI
ncbi:unnamed protein product [Rhizophagus irregularis]|nr:unnamed protein product [Rhizophagus irregularis]